MRLLTGKAQAFVLCCSLMLLGSHYVLPQSEETYQTFAFRKFEATVNSYNQMIHLDEENAQIFRSHVFKELEAHGLTLASSPDIYVDLFVQLEFEQQITGGYSGTSDGTIDGQDIYTSGISNYEVGTFIIQLIQPENGNMLWQGSSAIALWNDKKKKIQKQVEKVVTKIFKDFDPSILGT